MTELLSTDGWSNFKQNTTFTFMNSHELIRKYTQEIIDKETEFSQLRNELENYDLDDQQITGMIRLIDKKVQDYHIKKANRAMGRNLHIGGLITTLVGVIVIILSYYAMIGKGRFIIIPFGFIAFGLLTTRLGKNKMRQ